MNSYWTLHLVGSPRRVNHAAVAIGSTIFAFGGYDVEINFNFSVPIDIHKLDTVTLTWERLDLTFDENAPFQRFGHTAVAYSTKIYLWGGRNYRSACNTLYCFDTETLKWSKPLVSGTIPEPRDGHSACIIGDCIYIYGGYNDMPPNHFSTDLHMLDLKTMMWSLIETEGDPPSHRDFHTATAIGDKMFVFGGRGDIDAPGHTDRDTYCDKLYYLDTNTKRWICPPVFGSKPSGRRSHSAFEYNGKLYIFGGFNRILDSYFQDMFQYDPKSSTWKTVISKGTPPCARRRQICLVINNKVFISGGVSDSSHYNDLHILDLDPSLKVMSLVNVWEGIQKNQIEIETSSLPSSIRNYLKDVSPLEEEQTG